MCGIHAIISWSSAAAPPLNGAIERRLRSRGPDHLGTVHASLETRHGDGGAVSLAFTSTVLALRGDHIARQPLVHETTGSVLCWNGEAWKIRGEQVHGNDGEAVLALLAESTSRRSSLPPDEPDALMEALRAIEGPFAFIFFDKPARRVFYGRDRLGRRSLLRKSGSLLTLSSIADTHSQDWAEVEADGFYSIQLDDGESAGSNPSKHDWVNDSSLVSSIGHFNKVATKEPFSLCSNPASVNQLHNQLSESLRLRILDIPRPPLAAEGQARVAVLFSGGLDCTVLARLASDIAESGRPIDLLNVAFENPRIGSQFPNKSKAELYELCPDRITGRRSFEELVKTCPGRPWRFVTVNVPYTETREHRDEIVHLLYPHLTEMDLSIANALYFAARGQGTAITAADEEPQPYQTTARVLLSGLGADELFGGYSRHGAAYSRGGYAELAEELKLDVSRLGKRNLGRDDRVMAHWGREVRFPFLDESLVKWAIELPVWEKCDFENTAEEVGFDPEKRVLRLLAQSLGLSSAAKEKKRAIQFGARTAKMESGKVKGTTSIMV